MVLLVKWQYRTTLTILKKSIKGKGRKEANNKKNIPASQQTTESKDQDRAIQELELMHITRLALVNLVMSRINFFQA